MAANSADAPLQPGVEHVRQLHAKFWRVLELVDD